MPFDHAKIICNARTGDEWRGTWAEFRAANCDMEPGEIEEIADALNRDARYVGGGGAAAEFTVELDRPTLPHARDNPPWSHCGDPRSADFGTVFAFPAALGNVTLCFDRAGLDAFHSIPRAELGDTYEYAGRLFDVNTDVLARKAA